MGSSAPRLAIALAAQVKAALDARVLDGVEARPVSAGR